jgi:peptidylprolyl isomerase
MARAAKVIKAGDTVRVHYTGKLENNEIFDSSDGRDPLKFTVGAGELIPGFDNAVIGMKVGQKISVIIEPKDAYGEIRKDCFISIPREGVPADMQLDVGTMIKLIDDQQNPIPAVITEINEKSIQVDVNHFLAGKTLIFDIEVIETGLKV